MLPLDRTMRTLFALLLLVTLLLAPAAAGEATLAPATATVAAGAALDDGRMLVAQAQAPKKRKTLFDFLFGNDDEEQQQQEKPVVKQPKVVKPAAELPPAKPKIEKAEGATRLMVLGDSMAVDVGNALDRLYADDPNIVVLTQGVGSSSFVRPDYFDWPKALADQIAKNTFDIAVVIIGINDRQTMNAGGESYKVLTPEWSSEYSARVSGFVRQFRAASKPVIWIGLPPMPTGSYGQAMIQINEIQRLAVFGGGGEFLDIYDRFVGDDGNYSSVGPDLNGNRVKMRKDDGIHFTIAGADKLAFYLSQALKTYYRGGGTVGIEVADPLAGTDAQPMLRPPYQGLGQMKLLEVAGAVVPLTNVQARAAELVDAATAEAGTGFDMDQLLGAPVGRADAFGVGKAPEEPEEEAKAE
jgi:hypothetical protein